MSELIVVEETQNDCWNRIGVRGDRSCPELARVVHCHNCPVFAAASQRFLDAPAPADYLEEWTERLIAPIEETATDLESMLIFRLGEEWLGLPVRVLVEVANPRQVHRVPRREGILAGLVNIRGELHLCVHLARLLGIQPREQASTPALEVQRPGPPGVPPADASAPAAPASKARFIVAQRDTDRWVFPVDEVDQVYRLSLAALTAAPATLSRAASRLTRGVYAWQGRAIGYLDDTRLFETLRTRIS